MYRMKFKRDIMQDVRDIDKATKKAGEESISPALLEAFENMAFLMAKARHAQCGPRYGGRVAGWV